MDAFTRLSDEYGAPVAAPTGPRPGDFAEAALRTLLTTGETSDTTQGRLDRYHTYRGIRALLEGMQLLLGWEPIMEGPNIIGLADVTVPVILPQVLGGLTVIDTPTDGTWYGVSVLSSWLVFLA